jgi:hypothetical protein
MKKLIFLVMLAMSYASVTFAQEPAVVISDKPGWHKIGEVKADFKIKSESIAVFWRR